MYPSEYPSILVALQVLYSFKLSKIALFCTNKLHKLRYSSFQSKGGWQMWFCTEKSIGIVSDVRK